MTAEPTEVSIPTVDGAMPAQLWVPETADPPKGADVAKVRAALHAAWPERLHPHIEAGGDAKAMEYARKFDKYEGNVLLSEDDIASAISQVPEKLKQDIQFAHDNVKRFAEAQKATVSNVEVEVEPL